MDYAKLALAAQIRTEVMKEMGIESVKQTLPGKIVTHPDTSFEDRVRAVLDEVAYTANLVEEHIASGALNSELKY